MTRPEGLIISARVAANGSPPSFFRQNCGALTGTAGSEPMANTSSAKKATRKIVRRTIVNKARRTRMRSLVRKVEEAISAGDKTIALAALREAEPQIMRAAQKGVLPKNTASRKVARLNHRIVKLNA